MEDAAISRDQAYCTFMTPHFARSLRPRVRSWAVASIALWGLLGGSLLPAQQSKPWTGKETRLATEYLNLLAEKPEPGRVLDLLWELYDKRGQTDFLLQSIAKQAASRVHPNTLLVHAHLLRKAGRPDEAKALFKEVLRLEAGNAIALRALADLAQEAEDHAEALGYLKQVAAAAPKDDPATAATWLQLGKIALAAEKRDEAAAAWEQASKLQPQNAALNSEVAQLLLGAGFSDRALALYRKLAQEADPSRKLDALYDLSRLEEQADHFDEAAKCLRDGLSLLHFKDWRYGQFFQRLVKLHERFGRLDELKTELSGAAAAKPPQEKALADMARYSALTVEADEQVKWLRELTRLFPASPEYRWELVRVLLDHEGAPEAATLLDEVLKGDGTDVVALVLLRCEAHLRLGETEAAVARLKKVLDAQGASADVEKQVLAFAQERSLDTIVEQSLRARIARNPDRAEPVFELAAFLVKRKREAEAVKLCTVWLDRSTAAGARERLRQIASFLNAHQLPDEAIGFATRAAAHEGAGKEENADMADLLAQGGDTQEAMARLELAWTLSKTPEDRLDVDERILALLSGEQGVAKAAATPEPGSEFKLPSIFTGEGFGSEAPEQKRNEIPDAVREYAWRQALQVSMLVPGITRLQIPHLETLTAVLRRIAASLPPATPERILRAAWWCVRTEEWQMAYQLLARLHFDQRGHWVTAPIEVEKLLLDLALADQNVLLAIRQLNLLATLDPANRTAYMMRLADQEGHSPSFVASVLETRWQEEVPGQYERAVPISAAALSALPPGYQRAIRLLENVVKDEPQNESALAALSQLYIEGGRRDDAVALWEKAAEDAKGNAAPLFERYGELLLAQRKFKEFIEIQMRVIVDEPDIKRRRESFSRMLERLLWADVVQSNSLPEDEQKQRLGLIIAALEEHSRRAPFEGFWHEALATVYDKEGDPARAFAEMKQAYYTAPDTPYSLDQLRAAALKVGDQKTAIYFQKQIAASAAPKDEAAEWRQLVTLLEQDFRMEEADQVRRRMEARFAHDPTALGELAQYYADTGQDDAARRVQEQLTRVRSWDAKNLLRLALQQRRAGNDKGAEKTLRQLLGSAPPPAAAANQPPERLPWPLIDERKAQAVAPAALLSALDNTPGLEQKDRERLRAFLSLPRGEFVEVPEEAAQVRLRAVEELARLKAGAPKATADSGSKLNLSTIEEAWMRFYSGDGPAFREILRRQIASTKGLEARFVFAWLSVKSHGMADIIAWARDAKADLATRDARRSMLQAAVNMLADDSTFDFVTGDIESLGAAMLYSNTEIIDIARKLSGRQRHSLALLLTAAAQRNSPSLAADYALHLAQLAAAAGRKDLEKQYLAQAWAKPLEAGPLQASDAFMQSTSRLYRLAASPREREELLRASWQRLRQLPPSGQGALREARLLGLAGADLSCGSHLADYLGNGFLTSHRFIEPIMGKGLPGGTALPGPRIDEHDHLRAYWDDLREWGAILQGEGLASELRTADEALSQRHGGVPLGPKSNYEFSAWRNQMLLRQLRFANPPQRLRILREYLETDDSVETLINLGSFLEGQGRVRDCVEIYRRLPGRAFANVEYCEQFLRVCENSWECGIPIPYIERLFGAEPQFRPLNLAENLLEEKHALFLARLHDVVRLQLGAFRSAAGVRNLPGRMPAEVPYLRELALLLERTGDKPGALTAWEKLCEVWTQDAEAGLHRARLLLDQGNKTRALAAARAVDAANLWSEPVRQAVRLRAQLAADAGNWDEVRDVMNVVCGGTKASAVPHTGAVILIAGVLIAHDRQAEAHGLLLRAERSAKEANERFRLRLEQIKLLARAPAWQPQTDAPRIAALVRLDTSDVDALKSWADFMRQQASTPRARAWTDILASLPPSPTCALGLCSLAPQLSEQQASMLPVPWTKVEDRGPPAQRLAAEILLEYGKAAWAHAVATSGRGRALRDHPVMVRILHALGDRHGVDDIFSDQVHERFPGGGDVVGFCDAFAATGNSNLATELCELALQQQRAIGTTHMPLVHRYARLLIQLRQFEMAETLMLQEDDALTVDTASILVELYRGWNKLDRLPQELAKFHLPDGMQSETEFLAKTEKQNAK